MTINIFEGARRVGILIAGLVTVGTVALVIVEAPSVSATFLVDGPGTQPKRAVADYACSDLSASESQIVRTQKGANVFATLRFPPMRVTHNDVVDLSTAVRNHEKPGRAPNTLQYGEQVTSRLPQIDYSQVSDAELMAAITAEWLIPIRPGPKPGQWWGEKRIPRKYFNIPGGSRNHFDSRLKMRRGSMINIGASDSISSSRQEDGWSSACWCFGW